ncbi:hypothetical protein [Duncaniella dubosii]|uniref:hypothetical protein n=1 Tax=Duncaniella dubosii TaxID=2518971 RepID=UPI001E479376|nr:hypothetical protein [Duncaniella dubosii]
MKRDLTPLTFQTSIMCRKIGIARDGFYSSMKEDHKYNDSDFGYLDNLGYDFQPDALDCRADRDLAPTVLSASAWTTMPTSTGL